MASYTASSGLWSTCNSGSVPADGDVITVGGSSLTMDEDSATGEAFAIIIPANKIFQLNGWSFDGTVTLAGSGALFCGCNYISDDPGCDFAGTLTATSDGVEVWINTGTVDGEVDMDDHEVTWGNPTLDPESVSVGSIIYSTASSTLDLGTDDAGGAADASGISVEIAANTASATDIKCLGLTRTAGTITWTSTPTITVGDGGFNMGSQGFSAGYFNVSVLAGSTGGTLATSGGGLLLLTLPETSEAFGASWLTFSGLTGGGTLNIGAGEVGLLTYRKETFLAGWTGLITMTTGKFKIFTHASVASKNPAGDLRVTASSTGYVRLYGADDTNITWNGNIDVPELRVYSYTAAKKLDLTMTSGSNLSVSGNLTLGDTGSSGGGTVSVDGQLIVGGDIKRGHADNTQNALALNSSSVRLTGTLNGAGITITAAAGNKIVGGTLTEVNASLTETIRAYRAVGVDDVSNLNVDFRKRLGSGSGGGGLAGWHRVA